MTAPGRRFERDGLALAVDRSSEDGPAVFFQHGLCGDARQTAEVFPDDAGYARWTLECRGHGGSEAGPAEAFSIATFADDLAALIAASDRAPAIVGGISMGAAIALRLAARRPDLVAGLILARPAFVADHGPANMAPNADVGALLASIGPRGREAFLQSQTAARLRVSAPDNLASLLGFFDREPPGVTAALLMRISADGPGVDLDAIRGIRVPTLVIGHARDDIHPLGHARDLAGLIPGARLAEITPKAVDRARYVGGFRDAMARFLRDHPPGSTLSTSAQRSS